LEKHKIVEKAIKVVSEKENNVFFDFLYALIIALYIISFLKIINLELNAFIKIGIEIFFIAFGYFLFRLLKKIKEILNKYFNKDDKEYILAKEIEMKFKESEKRKKEEEKREKNIVLEKEKQENIKEFEGLLEEIKKEKGIEEC
jgi:hypothetical protein